MLADIEEISEVSGTITGVLEGIDDPEQAAKAYNAFTILHTKLKEYADKRADEEKKSSDAYKDPFKVVDTAEEEAA